MPSDTEILDRLEIIGELFLRLKAAAENADQSTPEGQMAMRKYWAASGALDALNWAAYGTPEMEMKLMRIFT